MNSFRHEGLRGGVWHGTVEGAGRPALALVHRGARIGPALLTQLLDGAGWQVAVPLPLERLTDGATTFLLVEDGPDGQLAEGGAIVARLPLIAGAEIAPDLQAELALMRAEIDLLLREFRRQSAASTLENTARQSDITAAMTTAEAALTAMTALTALTEARAAAPAVPMASTPDTLPEAAAAMVRPAAPDPRPPSEQTGDAGTTEQRPGPPVHPGNDADAAAPGIEQAPVASPPAPQPHLGLRDQPNPHAAAGQPAGPGTSK